MRQGLTDRSTISIVKRVYSYLTIRRRRQILILGIMIIFLSFVEAITIGSILPFLGALTTPENVREIGLLKPLLSYFDINDDSKLRLVFTVIFIGMVTLAGVFRVLYFWFQTRLSMAISIDFSVQVYKKTLYQPYGELISRNSSEILAGAQKAKDLVGYIIQPTLTFISSVFVLVAVLVTLFTIEPSVAISGLLGFGALYLFATTISKRLLQINSRTYAVELGRVNKAIQEGIGGIRDVIIDGTQMTFSKLHRAALTKLQSAEASNVILSQMPRYLIETLAIILLAVIAYFMMSQNGNFVTAIPVLGVLALGAQRLLPVLQQAYAAYTTIRGSFDSITDALNLLDQTVPPTVDSTPSRRLNFNKTLRVENLEFSYRVDSKLILKDINVEIKQGDRIGLIGATGSGKSTFVDIVMGLLKPTGGTVLIDGEKLSDGNIRDWHACVSHVPQAIFLADTTVAENIAFGIEPKNIDMGRVYDAARVAQISKTIEALPEGYHTFVGERGAKLSGGQRQRIGIARALYKRSKVLVLDEATSALDSKTESSVMGAIDSLGENVTVLLIAHRLSTLHNCDYIIELKDGSVSWVGTYRELTERVNT